MRSMTEQTPEQRIEALEAAAFRSGRDIAALRTEVGHIYRETRGLADWTARQEDKGDERHAEVLGQLDAVESKVDFLSDNVLKIMRHLGIPEGE